MATKAAKAASFGGHTAGIYADMTVDGPEIGTLVVIVDRAKNLPNRKTMGKQDPYCAARLGKEAKKTETDKRGGQTPRWDQEMRFTVHDSPDYYQLKVSVFNDDRKTELIGETWVQLEKIIIPGGGQNDLWHQLNSKGKYAGEIRIELTYYDTRLKEPKLDERRSSGATFGIPDQKREGSGGLSGPRQPKPMKRRPLPADPTMPDSSRFSPQPHTPPPGHDYLPSSQQHSSAPSSTTRRDARPAIDNHYPSPSNLHGYGQPSDAIAHGQIPEYLPMGQQEYTESLPYGDQQYLHLERPDGHSPDDCQIDDIVSFGGGQLYDHSNAPFAHEHGHPVNGNQDQRAHTSQPVMHHPKPARGFYSSSPPKLASLSQHSSMPDVRGYQECTNNEQQNHRSSLPVIDKHERHSPRHQSIDDDRGAQTNSYEPPTESNSPPPPPAHRSSGLQSPQATGRAHADSYPPISGPSPLHIRNPRNSVSASPLSQVQTSTPNGIYHSSQSPTPRTAPQPIPSRSAHRSQPDRRRSPEHFSTSPTRDCGQPTPPSLVPGYDPRIAEEESERLMLENQASMRQASEPAPQYHTFAAHNTQTQAQANPRYGVQAPARLMEDHQARRAHRASAPTVSQRGVSPETRSSVRKSVSPQPELVGQERQKSAVPFGPDSYDAFNPSLGDAASFNAAGPQYNTPEQSREALYEHERQAKLSEGPIIGSDGRVIDPSDHLPAETWAPEPETKAAKKKPEVTVRFRRSPAGAQPMPASARRATTETPSRPNPLVTSAYIHSSDPISPTAAARTRLQKRSRQAIAQPASSPAVPTINTSPHSTTPRANAHDSPLREHENYGYDNSPAYARTSPRAAPPPIPGKVPLSAGSGQEDWGLNALSEEMRRIDIGVGGGRARRTRYGN